MLSDHAEASFDDFFLALLRSREAEGETPPSVQDSVKDVEGLSDEPFLVLHAYAQAAAKQFSADHLTTELFVAAALVAFEQGQLASHRPLEVRLAQNRKNIDALITRNGWKDIHAIGNVADLKGALSFSKDFQTVLNSASHSPTPIATLLDAGISAGASLRIRERTAYHEAGHTIVSMAMRPDAPIIEVKIDPKIDDEGVTRFDAEAAWLKWPTSRDFVLTELCVALAGRVSEQEKFGHDAADAGATSDLESATTLAWKAIAYWGLDDNFGPISLRSLAKDCGVRSGWLYDEAQKRLKTLLQEAQAKTEGVVQANSEKIEILALKLLEVGRLTGDEVIELIPA
jgi:hypothetical protein